MEVSMNATSANFSSLCSIEDVQIRLRRLLNENSTLRNTLQQNNIYMRQLKDTMLQWQEEVAKLQEENRLKSVEAKNLVTKLRNQVAKLKSLLQQNGISLNDFESINQAQFADISVVTEPADLGSFIVVCENLPPEKAENPCVSFSSHSLSFENQNDPLLQQLQHENEVLRTQLHNEFERSKKDQKLLTETQAQLDQLTISHEKLLKQWVELSSIQHLKNEDIEYPKLVQDLEEKCASLGARLSSAQQLLLARQEEITQLHTEKKALETELETLPALRAQAEVYSADFEAERRAREQLAAEKDDLAQQLRLLRNRGQRVEEPPEPQRQQIECPKCNMVFTSMHAVENHLELCLNEVMFP